MFALLWLSSALMTLVRGSPLTSSPPVGGGGLSGGRGSGLVLSEFEDLPILVPDVANLDAMDTLKALGAEKFLELWKVYVLSAKVVLSDEPWTLVIPLNRGLPMDSSFLVDREYTREVLLNHVALGDVIEVDPAAANGHPFYSLADSELVFSKQAGKAYLNGIPLTGDEVRFQNGVAYVIEKTIPLAQPEFLQFVPLAEGEIVGALNPRKSDLVDDFTVEDDLANLVDGNGSFPLQDTTKTPQDLPGNEPITGLSPSTMAPETSTSNPASRPTRFEKFRTRLANKGTSPNRETQKGRTHTTSTSSSSTPETPPEVVLQRLLGGTIDDSLIAGDTASPAEEPMVPVEEFSEGSEFEEEEEAASSRRTTFVNSMLDELGAVNSNGAEFSHHFLDAQLDQYFDPAKNYTAIVPTNGAFYEYYPIDWGFNPFLVENFTKDVLLNHIIEGDIPLQSLDHPIELQTILGRTLQISSKKGGTLLVNGQVVPKETEAKFPSGRLYFVHRLLFVDYSRVNTLREEFPFLETAPLLSFPWPTSPFLSHLLKRLQESTNATLFAHLLRHSDVAHLVSSSDENLNRLSYSAFVPTDEAIKKSLRVENLALLNSPAINAFLLEHIVPGYLFEEDFEDGFNLLSLTHKAIPIRIANGDIHIGRAKILRPQQFVYNLGAIFLIDQPIQDLIPRDEPTTTTTILPHNREETEGAVTLPEAETQSQPPQTNTEDPITTNSTTRPSSSSTTPSSSLPITTPRLLPTTLSNSNPPTPPSNSHTTPPTPSTLVGQQDTTVVTQEPEVTYEIRTEVSFSRQINNGNIVPVSRDVIEKAKNTL